MTATPTTGTSAFVREDEALSREAVQSVVDQLPQWLSTLGDLRRLSGLQVAIWHDGDIVFDYAQGTADPETGTELLPTHRLRIASHSKMFTAITVMRLVEQGRMRLDDAVGDLVDDLADTPVADRTIRDLLSHSAGLTRDSSDSRWWALQTPFADRAKLIEIARDGAVVAEAGIHLQYSNIGYGFLGLAIEAVTGQSFEDAVTDLVLDPVTAEVERDSDRTLHLGADLPEGAAGPEQADGFAYGHTGLIHGDRRAVEQISTGALAAATGFWATAASIAEFTGRVFTDSALLTDRSRREMRRKVWTLREGGHYGLGLQQGRFHGFTALAHSGGFPTGLSRTWAVPASRLCVSVIGTSTDSPSSEIAVGILGLLALAAGRPAPDADMFESAAAGGGAAVGRPRPKELADQPAVTIGGEEMTAEQVAGIVEGTYSAGWGRTWVARLGDRLFELPLSSYDPAAGAIELAVTGTRPDAILDGVPCVELTTWGDTGYGSYFEPVLARVENGRCTGLVDTGQVAVPSEDFELPERIRAPKA